MKNKCLHCVGAARILSLVICFVSFFYGNIQADEDAATQKWLKELNKTKIPCKKSDNDPIIKIKPIKKTYAKVKKDKETAKKSSSLDLQNTEKEFKETLSTDDSVDEDKDGFPDSFEVKNGTDPKDPKSHPPLCFKLYVKSISRNKVFAEDISGNVYNLESLFITLGNDIEGKEKYKVISIKQETTTIGIMSLKNRKSYIVSWKPVVGSRFDNNKKRSVPVWFRRLYVKNTFFPKFRIKLTGVFLYSGHPVARLEYYKNGWNVRMVKPNDTISIYGEKIRIDKVEKTKRNTTTTFGNDSEYVKFYFSNRAYILKKGEEIQVSSSKKMTMITDSKTNRTGAFELGQTLTLSGQKYRITSIWNKYTGFTDCETSRYFIISSKPNF
jgi:hypothetical protein